MREKLQGLWAVGACGWARFGGGVGWGKGLTLHWAMGLRAPAHSRALLVPLAYRLCIRTGAALLSLPLIISTCHRQRKTSEKSENRSELV